MSRWQQRRVRELLDAYDAGELEDLEIDPYDIEDWAWQKAHQEEMEHAE